MIMYDFECSRCHKTFEALVRSSDERETPCPDCNYRGTRLMSAPHMFREIVPTTLTSKRLKAGYVHHFRKKAPDAPVRVQVPRGTP